MANDADLSVKERQSWTPAAPIEDLTDSSGGTASVTDPPTIVAIDETITSVDVAAAGPTDVPTSAAANAEFAKINDNMATLVAMITSLQEALRSSGVLLE